MRAAIFNPYLDTLGGGERYSMGVAQALLKDGYDVDLEWNSTSVKKSLSDRFGIDLTRVNVVADIKRGDGYDLCFWVSDGSIPTLRARHNILHFQVPFHGVKGSTLLNKMKLYRVKAIVCNSRFTKSVIDREYGVKSVVIYPPVDTGRFRPKRKENVILFVGRFSELKQSKGQDFLISAFKRLVKSGMSDWELILAGGTEVGADKYLKKLRRAIVGHPITIVQSPSFKELLGLYGRSKIFWSAAGYKVDGIKSPEKMEHFGMTVVEAMAAKVVPVVFSGGGHKEIVNQGKDGYLWSSTRELLAYTRKLIRDGKKLREMAFLAQENSKAFGLSRFEQEFLTLL